MGISVMLGLGHHRVVARFIYWEGYGRYWYRRGGRLLEEARVGRLWLSCEVGIGAVDGAGSGCVAAGTYSVGVGI